MVTAVVAHRSWEVVDLAYSSATGVVVEVSRLEDCLVRSESLEDHQR